MNIQTVADNLRATIAGKEKYLAASKESLIAEDSQVRLTALVMVQMLEINIAELKRILKDVEVCIADEVDANRFTGV